MHVAPDSYFAVGALYFLNLSYWMKVTCGVLALNEDMIFLLQVYMRCFMVG